jgi:molybdopterin-dependent oxidoreductase alpha subunit
MGAVKVIALQGARELGPMRSLRLLNRLNQKGGVDCPGCAWPDPAKRTPFEFCENGAKAIYEEAVTTTLGEAFFAQHSVEELTGWTDHALGKAGRLGQPMVLEEGSTHYRPIEWSEAFAQIADALNGLPTPDDAIFYTSGRTSNEAAFLYQLFVRRFGTNNLPDCSNLCHESSGKGLGEALGSGKGSVTLEDFRRTQAIFLFGQNPGTNHPRMLTALQEAKRAGATIVSINPLVERGLERFAHPQEPTSLAKGGTQLTDLYLQVRVGGDLALIKGLCKGVLALDAAAGHTLLDRDFIAEHTDGFEAFVADIESTTWADIEAGSGVPRDQIEAAARIYAESDATIATWAMGLTQHRNSVATIQGVVNLLLLKGNVGKPGAGPCPVRGHSNVQGDRTMGIWEAPTEAFLDALQARFGFDPPRDHGHAAVDAIKAMHDEPGKVFFAMGGNFLSANADTDYTAQALRNCALTVQVSTKLNRSHLITGRRALILPCLGRTDRDEQASGVQFVTCENSQGTVHPSVGFLRPPSKRLLSEPAIVCRLAAAVLGPHEPIDWAAHEADYTLVREHIAAVVPGFERFEERLQSEGEFLLPHPNRQRRFPTATGKARFLCDPLPPEPLADGQLMLTTLRSHDQYNTTIYGLDDRYRGIYGERRVLMMHRADMEARGLSDGDWVDITSHFEHDGQVQTRVGERFAAVGYDLPPRCCAAYFPEANVLVPIDSYAKGSKTPTSKSVVVTVERAAGA